MPVISRLPRVSGESITLSMPIWQRLLLTILLALLVLVSLAGTITIISEFSSSGDNFIQEVGGKVNLHVNPLPYDQNGKVGLTVVRVETN